MKEFGVPVSKGDPLALGKLELVHFFLSDNIDILSPQLFVESAKILRGLLKQSSIYSFNSSQKHFCCCWRYCQRQDIAKDIDIPLFKRSREPKHIVTLRLLSTPSIRNLVLKIRVTKLRNQEFIVGMQSISSAIKPQPNSIMIRWWECEIHNTRVKEKV